MLPIEKFQPYTTCPYEQSKPTDSESTIGGADRIGDVIKDVDLCPTPDGVKILTRENAVKLMKNLSVESSLAKEIGLTLLKFSSGIHSLSDGTKINATKERLVGGNDHKAERRAGTQELVAEARRESEGRYNILVIKAGHAYDITRMSDYLYKTEEKEVGGCRYKIYAFTQGTVVVKGDLGLINLDCWGPGLVRSQDRRTLTFSPIP